MMGNLLPLLLGSAIVPMQIVITIMLLSTPARVRAAGAWTAGMVLVRLVQGVVFGLILHSGATQRSEGGRTWIVSTILLIVAVLLLSTAVRELFGGDDPDAPPPAWTTMLSAMTPGKALLLGAGMITIEARFWVMTLGAIGVIGAADLRRPTAIAIYIVFVVLAVSPHLMIVGTAALAPTRSKALLDRALYLLRENNRVIMVVVGFVFGTWFMVTALTGFGLL